MKEECKNINSGGKKMRMIGNLFWFFLGGGIVALLWFFVGIICCCTIICIPVGLQCFKFASFTLFPFGRTMQTRDNTVNILLNAIWIIVFGWEIALTSVVIGAIWCITVVGIPMGVQCIKFARLALVPFGTVIVPAR